MPPPAQSMIELRPMPRKSAVPLIAAAAVFAVVSFFNRPIVHSQSTSALSGDNVVSLRVRFGPDDSKPTSWDGKVAVSGGELLSLRNWHPRPDDRVGKEDWTLPAEAGPPFQVRPWDDLPVSARTPYLKTPGLILDVKATAGTRLKFQTKNGAFEVTPALVRPGVSMKLLGGRVVVDRVASAESMSSADYQNDFATMLSGSGEVWAAWVGYKNESDDIFVRRFDGRSWSAAQKVTDSPADVFLVKMGRDRGGKPWVVWSAQVNGNFDLYARRFDGNGWSSVERLSEDPQPDIYHAVTTDSAGNMWVVWQGFRNGKSDIFARRYDGSTWSAAEQVSTSTANDWEPSVAACPDGRVYVGWDTYDKGNYDVKIRSFARNKWSDVSSIADTPKFEAHVSLACDKQNRVWAAWNESGFEWGKDTGFLVKRQGTRLYQWRSMGIAVNAGGGWQEPSADINQSLPQDMQDYNDFPVLQLDPAGRMWVFFRHRHLRIRDTPSDTPAHRAAWEIYGVAYEGSQWSAPLAVPFSQSRTDVRSGFASDGKGNLYAAWPTDNRDFEEFLFQHSDVYAGRLPLPAGSPAAPSLRARMQPALKSFAVHAKETEELRRIRGYAIESGGKTYHIYRGDTHRHSEFSMDGNNDGSLQQVYRYAIDAAELDYLNQSDHNGDGGPDIDYVRWVEHQMCDVLMLPRKFEPLYGYERSLNYPNGHRNVMFAKRGIPTLPATAAERQGRQGAKALYDYLKRYGGIAISHTSASNMGTDWRDNDPAVEPLVEIYQGDRVSAEYEGAPKAANAQDPGSAPGGFRPAGYVWNAWAKGYKLGIQAASDHLSTHISYACTIATDFTRDGLIDAMKQRHSYGATDNIILDYRMQAGGKEYLQGDIVKVDGDFKLSVKVLGTMRVRQIDIIRGNKFIHNVNPMERDVSFTYIDTEAPRSGETYYYVRVIQEDDQMAWSSPIWVQR
jgi:hypothetical protein